MPTDLFRVTFVGITSLATLLLPSSPLSAEDTATGVLASAFEGVQEGLDLIVPDNLDEKGMRVRLGAGFGALPDYVGSDNYRLKALPIVDIRFGKRWRLSYNRLSFSAVKKGGWEFGPLVKYKSGRSESRNPALAGLGNVKATAQVGAFLKYKDSRKMVTAEYRRALSEMQGSSIRVTLAHGLYESGPFKLAAAARAKWMSGEAMQTNFGITADQAAQSTAGLPAYSTKAGMAEFDLNLLARYDVQENHRLLWLVSYGRLMGSAADSPLVSMAGSRDQFKIGMGFTIDF